YSSGLSPGGSGAPGSSSRVGLVLTGTTTRIVSGTTVTPATCRPASSTAKTLTPSKTIFPVMPSISTAPTTRATSLTLVSAPVNFTWLGNTRGLATLTWPLELPSREISTGSSRSAKDSKASTASDGVISMAWRPSGSSTRMTRATMPASASDKSTTAVTSDGSKSSNRLGRPRTVTLTRSGSIVTMAKPSGRFRGTTSTKGKIWVASGFCSLLTYSQRLMASSTDKILMLISRRNSRSINGVTPVPDPGRAPSILVALPEQEGPLVALGGRQQQVGQSLPQGVVVQFLDQLAPVGDGDGARFLGDHHGHGVGMLADAHRRPVPAAQGDIQRLVRQGQEAAGSHHPVAPDDDGAVVEGRAGQEQVDEQFFGHQAVDGYARLSHVPQTGSPFDDDDGAGAVPGQGSGRIGHHLDDLAH